MVTVNHQSAAECVREGNDVERPLNLEPSRLPSITENTHKNITPGNILLVLRLIDKLTDSNYTFRDWSSVDWEISYHSWSREFIDWYHGKKNNFA